jgi:hypothetical protein
MTVVLSVSSILLIVLLGVRHFEAKHQEKRFFELQRIRLDRITNKLFKCVKNGFKKFVEFIHKDVFLYVIHAVIYVALLVVRLVERWLDRVTVFIRSFRKKRSTETSENLKVIKRENRESDEQNV